MGFSRLGNTVYWLPFPSPGDLPNPGIYPGSPALRADALPSEPPEKPTVALLLLLLSHFSRVDSVRPHRWRPTRLRIPGILQARTLEWVAISFSNAWKWKVKGKSLSRVQLFTTPWTAAHQAPPSMGFSRQEYWSGVGAFDWLLKSSFFLLILSSDAPPMNLSYGNLQSGQLSFWEHNNYWQRIDYNK